MVRKLSVSFFPSLKQFYCISSSLPDCIFEIHQLWQLGFSRVYSSCCCSCSFEPEIIKIGQSSYKKYNNNIWNFQESTTLLNAWTKTSVNLLNTPLISIYIYIYMGVLYPEILRRWMLHRETNILEDINRFKFRFLSPRHVNLPCLKSVACPTLSLYLVENNRIYTFSKGIGDKFNSNILVQSLNSGRRVPILRSFCAYFKFHVDIYFFHSLLSVSSNVNFCFIFYILLDIYSLDKFE